MKKGQVKDTEDIVRKSNMLLECPRNEWSRDSICLLVSLSCLFLLLKYFKVFFFFGGTGLLCGAQDGLKLTIFPQPHEFWVYRDVPPYLLFKIHLKTYLIVFLLIKFLILEQF
jgi:hypothetical protein